MCDFDVDGERHALCFYLISMQGKQVLYKVATVTVASNCSLLRVSAYSHNTRRPFVNLLLRILKVFPSKHGKLFTWVWGLVFVFVLY